MCVSNRLDTIEWGSAKSIENCWRRAHRDVRHWPSWKSKWAEKSLQEWSMARLDVQYLEQDQMYSKQRLRGLERDAFFVLKIKSIRMEMRRTNVNYLKRLRLCRSSCTMPKHSAPNKRGKGPVWKETDATELEGVGSTRSAIEWRNTSSFRLTIRTNGPNERTNGKTVAMPSTIEFKMNFVTFEPEGIVSQSPDNCPNSLCRIQNA